MLQVSNLLKTHGDRTLFAQASFTLAPPQKIGLVGPNGSGKTSLLRIIAGLDDPDEGSVTLPANLVRCYLPQFVDDGEAETVGRWLVPHLDELRIRLAALESALDENSLAEYGDVLDAFQRAGGYDAEARCESVLRQLDVRVDLDRPLATLSGGEKTRMALARVMLSAPPRPEDALLLLDEPTNHLDVEGVERLEAWLQHIPSACLIVSHDRRLLDRVTSRTLALDPIAARLREYGGNYAWYRARRAEEEARQWHEYEAQQERVRRLSADIRAVRTQARGYEAMSVNDFQRGKASRLASKAKARETRLQRELSDANRKDKPRLAESMRLELSGHDLHDTRLLEIRGATVTVPRYETVLLRDVTLSLHGSTRVLLDGANGSGKTTLIRMLLDSPDVRRGLRIGYLPQQQEALTGGTVLSWLLDGAPMEEGEARTFLHRFLFKREDVFKSVDVLSRGERTRLLLARLMAAQPDLLILDEPTNHLDLDAIEGLEDALDSWRGALVFTTHDRTFADRLRPTVRWHVEDRTVTVTAL